MAFIRRVRTASGATAVQIAEYSRGRQRIVKHLGSAHSQAELGVLLEQARGLLEDPAQGVLDLKVRPEPTVTPVLDVPAPAALFGAASVPVSVPASGVGATRDSLGRVVATDSRVLFEALAGVYAALGFDGLQDPVFADLVIARVVEPTSLLDAARVLSDLGRPPASYATMKRTLKRVVAPGASSGG